MIVMTGGEREVATGIRKVEARVAINKHPPMKRTAPTTKTRLVPNVNRLKIEKRCSRSVHINLILYLRKLHNTLQCGRS